MEILDLSHYATATDEAHGGGFALAPSQVNLVGFQSAVKIIASARFEKGKTGQFTVSALLNFIGEQHNDWVFLSVPLDAFPDVAVELKPSIKTFKLSRFSAFDFAFSILLSRLSEMTLTLVCPNLLTLSLKVGRVMVTKLIDLNVHPQLKAALDLKD